MQRVTLKERRNKAVKIATDLRYPDEIIDRLKKAETESEIDMLMTTGRHFEKNRKS